MIGVVLLCAGYGTRLAKDLEENKDSNYKHLVGIPKPLLPVHGKPLISHWLEIFDGAPVSEVVIVTNEAHKEQYEALLADSKVAQKPISLVSDGSVDNAVRSGAVACMKLGAKHVNGDVLFLAGDTLFDDTFCLQMMISRFEELKKEHKDALCLIVSAPVKSEHVSKHGIIEVESDGRVTCFLEKPKQTETSSRLQSPCCYLMTHSCLTHIEEFLESSKTKPLHSRDATGNVVKYLLSKVPVYAFHVSRRFDIGSLDSYVECCRAFS